jgi:hypothetical protein
VATAEGAGNNASPVLSIALRTARRLPQTRSSAWQITSPASVVQCHGARARVGARGGGRLRDLSAVAVTPTSIVCRSRRSIRSTTHPHAGAARSHTKSLRSRGVNRRLEQVEGQRCKSCVVLFVPSWFPFWLCDEPFCLCGEPLCLRAFVAFRVRRARRVVVVTRHGFEVCARDLLRSA